MVPILFLTARSSERDILLGYDLGCDDYIIKPFSLVTLYAKCKALIRRSKDISRTGELVCGRIHMKPSEYRVLVDSQEIELAPKEFALLRMLLENKNKTVARERLLIGVWGYDYDAQRIGGSMPTVYNAANEKAVGLFLDRKIAYLQIPELIREAMEQHKVIENPNVEEILETEASVYDFIEKVYSERQ